MKKLIVVLALVMSVATLAKASNVTDTGPGSAGDVLYFTGQAGNDQGTWSNLPSLVQTIVNNNITVPATVGSGVNGATPDTVGNLNFVGTGLTSSVSGSGSTATSNIDFSNLSTVEGQTNATNITNVSNSLDTTNSNVTNLTNTVNSNSTDISGLQTTVNQHTTQINQNTSDISTLNSGLNTTNTNVTNLSNKEAGDVASINNMSDPSTILNQTVNANTQNIAAETIRATGAESVLQSNINGETARATGVESGIQNMTDGSLLSNTVNTHTQQISALNTGLTNETNRAEGAEGVLQNNINNEASTRASADQALQNQINNVNAQAQDNTNRIDRLEQTKYLLEPTVRIYDGKLFQVQAFDSYDVRHGTNFALGARVMLKLGKSYEEKLLAKTNPEIARLLSANVSHDIAERDAIRQQLAEDRALIQKQSELLAKLTTPQATVLSVPVVSSDHVFGTPSKADEDLLQALDAKNEAFAAK